MAMDLLPAAYCWHALFVLWVYGHVLTKLGHGMCAGIHPFPGHRVPTFPARFENQSYFSILFFVVLHMIFCLILMLILNVKSSWD